ncbi:hypothetical protein F2Q70_00025703 [Brassica cretica]|uniref:Uncharacterized protein n=1 Tax=Brassica cretica TaxID=69181 RepID=A0A8S9L5Z0_BRACR|nr:hypothetical protein F2Q70_00025703 [Brassica cretica]
MVDIPQQPPLVAMKHASSQHQLWTLTTILQSPLEVLELQIGGFWRALWNTRGQPSQTEYDPKSRSRMMQWDEVVATITTMYTTS